MHAWSELNPSKPSVAIKDLGWGKWGKTQLSKSCLQYQNIKRHRKQKILYCFLDTIVKFLNVTLYQFQGPEFYWTMCRHSAELCKWFSETASASDACCIWCNHEKGFQSNGARWLHDVKLHKPMFQQDCSHSILVFMFLFCIRCFKTFTVNLLYWVAHKQMWFHSLQTLYSSKTPSQKPL